MVIKVDYSVSPIYINTNVSPIYIKVDYGTGGGGGAVWGDITGTLSDQLDLQAELDAKLDIPTGTTLEYIDGTGALQTFPLTLPVLQEVRNQTGGTLAAGTVVYINGATGNKPTVAKAIATGDPTSAQTLGMIQSAISNNGVGYVIVLGTCSNLDTSAYTEGDQLYLSGTVAGGVTTTKPYAPTHLVYIGIVTRSHPTLGTIEVRVQNGYELDELHDVSAQSPSNNDGIFYNTTTSLWEKKSIATALGYTPANGNIYTTDGTLTGNRVVTVDEKQLVFRSNASTLQNYTYSVGKPTGTSAATWPSSLIYEGEYLANTNSPQPLNTRIWVRNQASLGYGTYINQVYADFTSESTAGGFLYNQTYQTFRGSVLDTSVGTVSNIYGVWAIAGHGYIGSQATASNIVTTNQEGVRSDMRNYVGTISNVYAFRARSTVGSQSGARNTTITNNYGLHIDLSVASQSTYSSTVTNYYGIYINTTVTAGAGTNTVSNSWGIYAPDTAMSHYFQGNTVIGGSTLAGYKLDVQGTGRFTGNVTFGGEIFSPSISYFNGPTANTGTLNLRYATVNINGTTNVGILNVGDTLTVSGINTTANITGTGVVSFRISNTASSSVWYFENKRNAVAGALEISNDISNPTITLFPSRSVAIGSYTETTSSILALSSTTKGFLRPRMTTTERNAISTPATGLSIYNTTTNTNDYYNGTAWVSSQAAITDPVTGTGTSGQVSYWTGTSTQSGSNNLFWDNTNGRLGIGTNSPTDLLHIYKSGQINNAIISPLIIEGQRNTVANGAAIRLPFIDTSRTTGGAVSQQTVGAIEFSRLVNSAETQGSFNIYVKDYLANTLTKRLSVDYLGNTFLNENGGSTILGTTTNLGQRLQVTGTTLLSGSTQITGSTTAASAIARGVNVTSTLVAAANGDVLVGLDIAPTFTLGAFTGTTSLALRVTGDTRLVGSGNTSASTALTVQNSGSTNLFRILNDGTTAYGTFSENPRIYSSSSGGTLNTSGASLTIDIINTGDGRLIVKGGNQALTSGQQVLIDSIRTYNPTSGTATYIHLNLTPTINQTGGASGITRGLYVNPTLTAAADWRSIEWSNNTGWGLYGAGTANNYMAGSLGIGSTSLTGRALSIEKTMTGSVNPLYITARGVIQSDVTGNARYFNVATNSQAATFSTNSIVGFEVEQGTLGVGNTVSTQIAFSATSSLTGATNNYGFYGNIASATGRWNLYMNGTALNYMNGALLLGSTTSTGEKLQVTGTAKITSKLSMGAGTTSDAQINLASSTAPTTPNNGDIWFDGTDLKMRIGGVTKTFTLV